MRGNLSQGSWLREVDPEADSGRMNQRLPDTKGSVGREEVMDCLRSGLQIV